MNVSPMSLLVTALFTVSLSAVAAPCELRTEAEKSSWLKTGRYEEVEKLGRCFEKTFPGRVELVRFGTTPEQRTMWALVVSDQKQGARPKVDRPVVYFQGGIHAGEIDGKDAGFLFLREVLEGKVLPGLLKKLTVVFVPVLNVDGHERFGAHNRPNQVGPAEMGWRVTSQNLNLNRDYMKADAPEMRAVLALMRKWDPILAIDLHVTDGADFQNEISVIVEPSLKGPEMLRARAQALSDETQARLKLMNHPSLAFYPSFEVDDDPASGITLGMSTPRFFHGYWQLRNRIGVLVETHSWKNYANRVRSTHDALLVMTEQAEAHAASEWLPAARAAEKAGPSPDLGWQADQKVAPVSFEFPGYEYQRVDSPVSGRKETVYDPTRKSMWKIPLWSTLKPRLEVAPPPHGYVIAAGAAETVAPRLLAHGIRFEVVKKAGPAPAGLEVFRATETEFSTKPFEGRTTVKFKGEWRKEARELPAGSLLVPLDQPLARLIQSLLEPLCSDSLPAWGFLNASLEQKEYMEPYVAHQVGLEMLKDPAIRAEFEQRLKDDKAFQESPEKRLEFFYRKHASWDERFRLLPVYRY